MQFDILISIKTKFINIFFNCIQKNTNLHFVIKLYNNFIAFYFSFSVNLFRNTKIQMGTSISSTKANQKLQLKRELRKMGFNQKNKIRHRRQVPQFNQTIIETDNTKANKLYEVNSYNKMNTNSVTPTQQINDRKVELKQSQYSLMINLKPAHRENNVSLNPQSTIEKTISSGYDREDLLKLGKTNQTTHMSRNQTYIPKSQQSVSKNQPYSSKYQTPLLRKQKYFNQTNNSISVTDHRNNTQTKHNNNNFYQINKKEISAKKFHQLENYLDKIKTQQTPKRTLQTPKKNQINPQQNRYNHQQNPQIKNQQKNYSYSSHLKKQHLTAPPKKQHSQTHSNQIDQIKNFYAAKQNETTAKKQRGTNSNTRIQLYKNHSIEYIKNTAVSSRPNKQSSDPHAIKLKSEQQQIDHPIQKRSMLYRGNKSTQKVVKDMSMLFPNHIDYSPASKKDNLPYMSGLTHAQSTKARNIINYM